MIGLYSMFILNLQLKLQQRREEKGCSHHILGAVGRPTTFDFNHFHPRQLLEELVGRSWYLTVSLKTMTVLFLLNHNLFWEPFLAEVQGENMHTFLNKQTKNNMYFKCTVSLVLHSKFLNFYHALLNLSKSYHCIQSNAQLLP